MASGAAEWDDAIHGAALESYHLAQWKEPNRANASKRILDIGCGAGAATSQLATAHPYAEFVGIDLSPKLIGIANSKSAGERFRNLTFAIDDWFDLKRYPDVDGVMSLQTLSWLPEFETPLRQVFEKVAPAWIALSSLFYEGDISCKIEVDEHAANRRFFYNVYSIPAVSRFAAEYGYRVAEARPFEIDIDLPQPDDADAMGTYTVRTAEPGAPKRLQISGPLLMNWHYVMLEKQPA
jgi:SAM-dependent methyltransferase